MNALVPDFAMVPRLLISSFLVMPMPESSMVKVEFVLSGMILMKKLGWAYETQLFCALPDKDTTREAQLYQTTPFLSQNG